MSQFIRIISLSGVLLCGSLACDTESRAKPYAEMTKAEKAREALDKQDFETAIALYREAIAADAGDYESYRFLSAAYAGLGGFDILDAVKGVLEDSSSNLLDSLGSFLPAHPTDAQIEALRNATETMLSLPESMRDANLEANSGIVQQLQFYQAAYSVIYLNKFATVTPEGTLDPTQLETMTDADVDMIIDNFQNIAETMGDGVVTEGVEEILEQLDSAPGESRRDKLINYLNSQKQGS